MSLAGNKLPISHLHTYYSHNLYGQVSENLFNSSVSFTWYIPLRHGYKDTNTLCRKQHSFINHLIEFACFGSHYTILRLYVMQRDKSGHVKTCQTSSHLTGRRILSIHQPPFIQLLPLYSVIHRYCRQITHNKHVDVCLTVHH